jgi:hypothetical protein
MQKLLYLLAGILLGWLGALVFQTGRNDERNVAESVAGKVRSSGKAGANDSRIQRSSNGATPAATFAAQIKAAVRQPVESQLTENAQGVADARLSAWLTGTTLSEAVREEILTRYDSSVTAGETDPLAPGTPFDIWLRERLDPDSLSSWNAVKDAHSADVVERRANQMLSGLQGALSLSPAQKDTLYPQLVEWAREAPPTTADGDRWLEERLQEISKLIPADQHALLEQWAAEFFPTYWMQESGIK